MSLPPQHSAHPKVVQRQLAQSRVGHAGHSRVAAGLLLLP